MAAGRKHSSLTPRPLLPGFRQAVSTQSHVRAALTGWKMGEEREHPRRGLCCCCAVVVSDSTEIEPLCQRTQLLQPGQLAKGRSITSVFLRGSDWDQIDWKLFS